MNLRGITRATVVCALVGSVTGVAQAEKIYWRENQGGGGGTIIKRSNLDGTDVESLVTIPTANVNSFGLALDLDGGKMYWAAREDGNIRRANLDGTSPEDILTGLILPLNVALDIPGGRVYWTQDSTGSSSLDPGVFRANLDGSGVEQLLAGIWQAIALDLSAGKMYLVQTTPMRGPSRANLDGSGLELLIDDSTFDSVFGETICYDIALDLDAGKMYFTAYAYFMGDTSLIGRANLDGSSPEIVLSDTTGDPDPAVGFPIGLALDAGRGTMYWSNVGWYKIYRAHTDGTEVTVIHDLGSLAPSTLALDLTAGPPIPAMSEWGAAAMTLLVLTAGTLVLARRRAAMT